MEFDVAKKKPITKKTASDRPQFEAMEVFQRARWKHGMRIFGVVLMCVLNVALVMSDIERMGKHLQFSISHEVISYVALLILDVTILLPLLFEVDSLEVLQDKLILKTIFWKAKLDWNQIISFKTPPMLKFAILKTARCFYLINRRDIKRFAELAELILKHINPPPPKDKG
jgi:hypothetical protein